jgi:NADH:ubiquinone oxidoreductase subunit B-like Fe-S oxidoreductase
MNDLWIERYAEILGCDPHPNSVAVAIADLKAEVDRARKTITDLRKSGARTLDIPPVKTGWQI